MDNENNEKNGNEIAFRCYTEDKDTVNRLVGALRAANQLLSEFHFVIYHDHMLLRSLDRSKAAQVKIVLHSSAFMEWEYDSDFIGSELHLCVGADETDKMNREAKKGIGFKVLKKDVDTENDNRVKHVVHISRNLFRQEFTMIGLTVPDVMLNKPPILTPNVEVGIEGRMFTKALKNCRKVGRNMIIGTHKDGIWFKTEGDTGTNLIELDTEELLYHELTEEARPPEKAVFLIPSLYEIRWAWENDDEIRLKYSTDRPLILTVQSGLDDGIEFTMIQGPWVERP